MNPLRQRLARALRPLIQASTLVTLLVAGSPVQAGSPHDWPMYNYDVLGSRFNRAETTLNANNASQLEEKWRFPMREYLEPVGVIHATPAVVDGYVYFGTATYPSFYKLTPDGKLCWEYKLGKKNWASKQKANGSRLVPADGIYTTALVTDDAVFFGDAQGRFFSLDRANGELNWQIDSRDEAQWPDAHDANLFMASPIMVKDQLVIAGGAYEHMHPLHPLYRCCKGRGCVASLNPKTGELNWKYDVGPKPETFDPPLTMEIGGVKRRFHYGPSTSSVWSTPSYDASNNHIYFGTDVHNAPRRPTDDDPRNYTEHSAAVIALNAHDGSEAWVCQINPGDVWNHSLPTYDAKNKKYKDQSIGDTPKLFSVESDGKPLAVVGVGCKNGGFYIIDRVRGTIVNQTPLYTGPPTKDPVVDPRTLALPSAMGGLQTGCATDGTSVFTNAIDNLTYFPSGGRVTSISLDLETENWRHERPRVEEVDDGKNNVFKDVGDPVGSGIALANGVAYFTTMVSNKLVAIDTATGALLREIEIGPVFAGPSVSRGRVYIGTGNTLFSPAPSEGFFRKQYTGTLFSFGLPGEDEVTRLGSGSEAIPHK